MLALALAGAGCNGDDGGDEDADAEDMELPDTDVDVDPEIPPDEVEDDVPEDEVTDPIEDEVTPHPARVIILHTNDEHSQLLADGPMVDDWPPADAAGDGTLKGGIYRRAIAIDREKTAATADGIPVLTVSAGDYSMGTLFHLGSVLQGVDYKLMKLIGYDAATIGNHEFDFGAGQLATMLSNGGLIAGPVEFPVVSSNIHFTSSTSDDALEDLYNYDGTGAVLKGYSIRELADGTRVGIIGYTGLDSALVAPFKSPVYFSFAFTAETCTESADCADGSCVDGRCTAGAIQDHATHMPALVADVAEAVRAVRAQDVDLVVALAHAGVSDSEAEAIVAGDLDPLDAVYSEDITVATGVMTLLGAEGMAGIDVIVSGHSHTPITSPIVIPDPEGGDGRTILVQAGAQGYFLGRLEIYRDDVGLPWQVEADGSRLIEVDDTIPVSELASVTKGLIDTVVGGTMEAVEEAVLEDALNVFNPGDAIVDDTGVIGDLFFYTLAESAFDLSGGRNSYSHRESPAMHLATDASRAMINQAVYPTDPIKAYIQANGVVRSELKPSSVDGALSAADVFSLQPLGVSPIEETPGYPLIDVYLTAGELKAGLEIGVSMGFDASSFFLGYSGVKIEYDPNLPAFDPENPTTTGRITKMTLWDPTADAADPPWDDSYSDVIFDITVTPDPFSGRVGELVHVGTNLYIGLFIDGFGICPRNSAGDMDPLCGTCANTDADCDDGLGNTATCINDAISPGVGKCVGGSIPSVIKYIIHFPGPGPEVKEWLVLMGFLQNLPDTTANGIPDLPSAYDVTDSGVSFPSRVCCVQSPMSSSDPCCHSEPCPSNYVACP